MTKKILVLKGDGIGPEIVDQTVKVIRAVEEIYGLSFELEEGLIGGAAIDAHQNPLPQETIALSEAADSVLLGAVGGPKWDNVDYAIRPEKGLLDIRGHFNLFANLRPALLYPELASASSLKPELVANLDIMIIRELTGGIYFGQPRENIKLADGRREAINTMRYNETEISRIAEVAFQVATKRQSRVTSVDKANVLEVSRLWRDVVTESAKAYPHISLDHMYVDNAAMQLVRTPKQFDVIVTGNLFGDILSDISAMLTGSIGMLPSASLNDKQFGLYEPVHGSAPDIAGQNKANPIATVLSFAMMCEISFEQLEVAKAIRGAVENVLAGHYRTADISQEGEETIGTIEMGDAIVSALRTGSK